MVQGARRRVGFRRRREGRTDYRRRLRLLRSGTARAVVRKSLNQVQVQIVGYDERGDRILASAVSGELRDFGLAGGAGGGPPPPLPRLFAGGRAAGGGGAGGRPRPPGV